VFSENVHCDLMHIKSVIYSVTNCTAVAILIICTDLHVHECTCNATKIGIFTLIRA
jgi:hypothetical protein